MLKTHLSLKRNALLDGPSSHSPYSQTPLHAKLPDKEAHILCPSSVVSPTQPLSASCFCPPLQAASAPVSCFCPLASWLLPLASQNRVTGDPFLQQRYVQSVIL